MSIAHEANPETQARRRTVAPPTIREHRIPTAGSKPYIAVEGRDGCLWFCESGTSKIGRLDPNNYAFREFALPTPNATPIGIVPGPNDDFWFAEKTGNKIGRITPKGEAILRKLVASRKLEMKKAGPILVKALNTLTKKRTR